MRFKDLDPLIKEIEKQGWTVDRTSKGHVRFRSPEGKTLFTSSTPSDWRVLRNVRGKLRREGANV